MFVFSLELASLRSQQFYKTILLRLVCVVILKRLLICNLEKIIYNSLEFCFQRMLSETRIGYYFEPQNIFAVLEFKWQLH